MEIEWSENIYIWIEHYSNINYMSDRWLGVNKEDSSCFDEDFNILFYDLSFDDFIDNLKRDKSKESLLKRIIEFRNLLFFYKEPQSGLAIDILNDPKYLRVVHIAKQIIDKWNI